ncbi:hypothetical protein [Methylotenera sp.]|uniref:hypothetical protein n=1 Tax=Methylotenera sp. TaxID=2051956 RepID=UPI00273601CB|nr:hypothetical protein [Methylotenera sp.]MDP3777313.1 hypothetical protein [Methylotenera sp.]
MKIKPPKDHAIRAAIKLTPQYADWLCEIQNNKGHGLFPTEISNIQKNLGSYVLMYDDERKIGRAVFLSLLGDEGYKEWNSDLKKLTPDEQKAFVDEMSDVDENEIIDTFSSLEIPSTAEEWQAARDLNANLPEDQRKQLEKQSAYFWCFVFATFFNTFSLMIHGTKLTTLVPQAVAGDDDAYLKAIQIDRLLLLHYPYFRDRKFRAQDEGDTDFLNKIAYREKNSFLRSKIRYPALYMLFGILDTYGWLNHMTHSEILDICDQAQLDRFQYRIEDVNCITKRLKEYRNWQKTGGVSMH